MPPAQPRNRNRGVYPQGEWERGIANRAQRRIIYRKSPLTKAEIPHLPAGFRFLDGLSMETERSGDRQRDRTSGQVDPKLRKNLLLPKAKNAQWEGVPQSIKVELEFHWSHPMVYKRPNGICEKFNRHEKSFKPQVLR